MNPNRIAVLFSVLFLAALGALVAASTHHALHNAAVALPDAVGAPAVTDELAVVPTLLLQDPPSECPIDPGPILGDYTHWFDYRTPALPECDGFWNQYCLNAAYTSWYTCTTSARNAAVSAAAMADFARFCAEHLAWMTYMQSVNQCIADWQACLANPPPEIGLCDSLYCACIYDADDTYADAVDAAHVTFFAALAGIEAQFDHSAASCNATYSQAVKACCRP